MEVCGRWRRAKRLKAQGLELAAGRPWTSSEVLGEYLDGSPGRIRSRAQVLESACPVVVRRTGYPQSHPRRRRAAKSDCCEVTCKRKPGLPTKWLAHRRSPCIGTSGRFHAHAPRAAGRRNLRFCVGKSGVTIRCTSGLRDSREF